MRSVRYVKVNPRLTIASLSVLDAPIAAVAQAFLLWTGRPPEAVVQAPGRLEVLGNHTDYNGGRVLGMTLDRFVTVAGARRPDSVLRVASPPRAVVTSGLLPEQPRAAHEAWANYVLGVAWAFAQAGYALPGADLYVQSTLPEGAGLSSSAALAVATAGVLDALAGTALDALTRARLARHAEHAFAGVPCGFLDQAVVACGDVAALVLLDAATETVARLALPQGAAFWVVRPAQAHALAEAPYAARHAACRAALAALQPAFPGLAHLCALTPAQLDAARPLLTDVLYRRAAHVVGEHARVAAALAALTHADLPRLGRLLTASHASSRLLFENTTPVLDALVAGLTRHRGVYGARLTGGGWGGAVLALTHPSFTAAAALEAAHGLDPPPEVFRACPAPGARRLL